ncbi:V-type ATP synthase subunit B [Rubrobacter tropicus]|uniref:V-type ATP synthase beta chain n=1 Tax=Rubrobacter tropicus TaxID=2653851 RepID=A0A6G8Q4D9_9ACTN|nr:V-type ATP synthase subunit B [Rubrobacter tropicus]QIN81342.1 V-type ATP synthase subunit B [Rubrobacter tropicus]
MTEKTEQNGGAVGLDRLFAVEHRTVSYVSGPLLVAEGASNVGYDEVVDVVTPAGEERRGQVLEVEGDRMVVQVLGGTRGLDRPGTNVRTRGEVARMAVGPDLVGRILDGSGTPIDDGPPLQPAAYHPVGGEPLNPFARAHPSDFIETGISAIDGLNTLVRGQKLPIFSGFGLPAMELAAQIAEGARVPGSSGDAPDEFVVVFAAIGVTQREAAFFRKRFAGSAALERSVLFINQADDPTIERLLTPRAALTAAEYLAWEEGRHVLVILADITNYCEALREVSAARGEIPGRRGYPGYMYTDLASLFERAGRVHGKEGSVTQIMILSMPDDDITHPIPDLTGYITEGQIVLSRDLDRRNVYPPIDVLPSLSRLMNAGIGDGKTRYDHRQVADQLYAAFARGKELRRLVSIVGEQALSEEDRRYLAFADDFENEFVGQGSASRAIEETLETAWRLLDRFPPAELKRIKRETLERRGMAGSAGTPEV